MTNDYPTGPTPYEQRESLGEPQFWVLDENRVACAMKIRGHESWVVEASFHVSSSQGVQLDGLSIKPLSYLPSPPMHHLTTEVIRSVRLDDLYLFARQLLPHAESLGMYVEADPSAFKGRKRPGRAGRPDAEYLFVAVRYVDLVRTSESPTAALAEELSVSRSAARDLVHEARQRDLLTPTRQGVKGGQLTPKALKLLADIQRCR